VHVQRMGEIEMTDQKMKKKIGLVKNILKKYQTLLVPTGAPKTLDTSPLGPGSRIFNLGSTAFERGWSSHLIQFKNK
jgi:hypothetical protein